MKHPSQSGFTLVEIAIVLVIIGILLGGAVKGQELIKNAEYNSWKAELNELRAAIYTFKDVYGGLPGDLTEARLDARLGGADHATDGANGDGTVSGGYCGSSTSKESCFVIYHLRQAGLIAGSPAAPSGTSTPMEVPVGGYYDGIATGNWINNRTELRFLTRNVPAEQAARLDDETDDGDPATGSVVCYTGSGACTYDDGTLRSVFVTVF